MLRGADNNKIKPTSLVSNPSQELKVENDVPRFTKARSSDIAERKVLQQPRKRFDRICFARF